MTKTEELRETMYGIVIETAIGNWASAIDKILQACAAAGLVFVKTDAELPNPQMNKPYHCYQADIIDAGWHKTEPIDIEDE